MPMIHAPLKEAFNVEKIMFSMNAEEASAVGAAYVGATKSTEYVIQTVIYESKPLYGVQLRDEAGKMRKFEKKPGKGDCWIMNNVTGQYPVGSSLFLTWATTDENTTIGTSKDGLYRFRNLPSKITKPWKTRVLQLSQEIDRHEQEKTLLDGKVTKLEHLLLEMKETMTDETVFKPCTTENERKSLETIVSSIDKWFLNQQSFEPKEVSVRLEILEDAMGGVMCRIQNQKLLPEAEANMTRLFKDIEKTMSGTCAKKKPVPARKEIRAILRMITDLKLWYQERKERQAKRLPTEVPSLLWSDLRDRIMALEEKFNDVKGDPMGLKAKRRKMKEVYVSGGATLSMRG